VFLLFVVLTFLGESFAASGLFMLPLVEEACFRKCHESGHKMMDCSKDFNEENSEPEQHHAGTDDRQDDETKQDDSKGRKTNKQSHVDVDVTMYGFSHSVCLCCLVFSEKFVLSVDPFLIFQCFYCLLS
jgi:hypothetical protein